MSTEAGEPRTESVADLMDADAEEWRLSGERTRVAIEDMERRLVKLRDDRDRQFRLAAEARTAANILREVGLRSSVVAGVVQVDLDYQPTRPSEPAR